MRDNLGYAYNKNGAIYGAASSSDSIWIDCEPTGESGELLIDENKDERLKGKAFSLNFDKVTNNIANNTIVGIIVGILTVSLSIMIILYIEKRLFPKTSSTTSVGGGNLLFNKNYKKL